MWSMHSIRNRFLQYKRRNSTDYTDYTTRFYDKKQRRAVGVMSLVQTLLVV